MEGELDPVIECHWWLKVAAQVKRAAGQPACRQAVVCGARRRCQAAGVPVGGGHGHSLKPQHQTQPQRTGQRPPADGRLAAAVPHATRAAAAAAAAAATTAVVTATSAVTGIAAAASASAATAQAVAAQQGGAHGALEVLRHGGMCVLLQQQRAGAASPVNHLAVKSLLKPLHSSPTNIACQQMRPMCLACTHQDKCCGVSRTNQAPSPARAAAAAW